MSPSDLDADVCRTCFVTEFCAIPLDCWRCYFPCLVASWRFVVLQRPGVLDGLVLSLADQPFFDGEGAAWFSEMLNRDDTYMAIFESIFHVAVPAIPAVARARGYLLKEEVQLPPRTVFAELGMALLRDVDEGESRGLLRRG